jgi:hypothetical protein
MNRLFDFQDAAQELIISGRESNVATARARAASEGLRGSVELLGWKFLDQGQTAKVDSPELLLVVGVVTWDEAQLAALRDLAAKKEGRGVLVFDLDRMLTQEMVSRAAPGIPAVREAPLAALYRSGNLERFGQGAGAFQLMRDYADS